MGAKLVDAFFVTLGVIGALWLVVIGEYYFAIICRWVLSWGRQKDCGHNRVRVSFVVDPVKYVAGEYTYLKTEDGIYGKCVDCGIVIDGYTQFRIVDSDENVSRETKSEGDE